jgi:hypothetical protein
MRGLTTSGAREVASAIVLSLGLALAAATPASAQQATGEPGSPSATTTIDRQQIPPPPPQFRGKIERNAPWEVIGAVNQDPAGTPYELYDLSKD